MHTLLYGLILARNAHRLPERMEGVRGVRVSTLDESGLTALVSDYDHSMAPDLKALRAHDAVTQSAVRAGATIVPTRFPQLFSSDAELRAALARHASEHRATLERLDGCVEMHLLLEIEAQAAPKPSATTPGRAYLESLRDSGRVLGLSLRAALGPVVKDETVSPLPRASGAVFCHLIQRDDEKAYRDAVATQPSLSEARIVGPLALYSFAEGR